MTPFSFQTKRAHWAMTWFGIRDFRESAVRFGQPELEHMTPARFDILYMLLLEQRDGIWKRAELAQRVLVERLGLHRSTVSKTVSRMIELGMLAVVERHYGRSRLLGLTELGARAVAAAIQRVLVVRRLDRHLREFARGFVGGGKTGSALRYAIASFLSEVSSSGRELVLTFGIWSWCPYQYLPEEED